MRDRPYKARVGWVVDVQNDFMRPDGRLYVKDLKDDADRGAIAAQPAIEAAVAWMRVYCDVMVYTGDWHGYGDAEIDAENPDPEAGTYPPHCMGRSPDRREREGARIIESVRPADPVVLEVDAGEAEARDAVARALGEDRPLFIRKVRFDVFEGNAATEHVVEALEATLGPEVEVWVVGVARDVCVTAAVDGLAARGYEVVAITDATWGLGLEDEEVTLDRWARNGRLATTADLPDPARSEPREPRAPRGGS